MLITADGKQLDTDEVSREVARTLGDIQERVPEARPFLIFPVMRAALGNPRRVSEQESKILFAHWLNDRGFIHSVETPSRHTYKQTGTAWISARTDVTVYGSFSEIDRVLNIELKAGTQGGRAGLESFRKDLEKLLREEVPGLWFHTLVGAPASWRTFGSTIHNALEIIESTKYPIDLARPTEVTDAVREAKHSIHFAFAVLQSGTIEKEFTIDFRKDWRSQLDEALLHGD